MVNKEALKDKYSKLINGLNIDYLKKEISNISSRISISTLGMYKPTLVYSRLNRDVLVYYLSILTSLKHDRILDYYVTTAQNYVNEHFLDSNKKDVNYADNAKHVDVLYIILSDTDYTSEYTESLIIDLVETRRANGRTTYIIYDIVRTTNDYKKLSAKLLEYFINKNYDTIELTSKVLPKTASGQPKHVGTTNSKGATPFR